MTATPLWFGPEEAPLFGWFHAPAGGECRAVVVVSHPIGQEYKNAHFSFRRLADRLAAQGIATLRYDHPGTGDSAGGPRELGWVAAWSAGLRAAVDQARRCAGPNVFVVGMRLGATLAAAEAAALGPLAGLILWDPCDSGRNFLRQQRLLGAAAAGLSVPEDVRGFVQGPSFLLPEELNRALPWPSQPVQGVGRVLVLLAPHRKKPANLAEWLGPTPADVEKASGQAELLERPAPAQIVPDQAIDRVVGWIDQLAGTDTTTACVPDARRTRIRNETGQEVVEEAIEFGGGLFGILTDPVSSPAQGPALIFGNVANDHHIGPGRLWVDLARHFATLGLRSLRFDLSGIGDSPPREGEPELRLCLPVAFDDTLEAMKLASPLDPRHVVLLGLCTSGYQSLETAMEQRPLAVCAINPVVVFVPPEVEDGHPMDARRRFCIPPSPVVGAARNRRLLVAFKDRYPELTWRLRHLLSRRNLSASRFRDLVGLGVDTLLVCGPYEAMTLRQSGPRLVADLERTGLFHLEVVNDMDHSLPTLVARERAARLIEEFIVSRYVPSGDQPGPILHVPTSETR